ncbi:MAG: NADH-quinone oxidoreductase subunit NuoG [Desulfohalobiaceae bacterium]|nr:NADH-quinone oxidoreductase subunit NuoG [Desulfohalobiaceae bacterium]
MPTIIIDDRPVEVESGTKVIDAAEQLGIMIPRFCYHPALGAVGACRVCAVKFVDGPVKGIRMSCIVEAKDGMVVSTSDPEAIDFRRHVIEWLMLNHPHDCPVCDEGGHCLLQEETVSGGHGIRKYPGPKRTYLDQDLGLLVQHEMNRCIHCYRCSGFYQDYAGYRDLGALQIASNVYFGRFTDGRLESPFAGNLIDVCPTGVYTDRPSRYKARRWNLERSPSVCPHCSLGCNTMASARYRELIRQEARRNDAVNGHFICDRGRYGFAFANRPDRPRQPKKLGRPVDWAEGLESLSGGLRAVEQASGAAGIATLTSGRAGLETLAMLKRLSRLQGWGSPLVAVDSARHKRVLRAIERLDEDLACSLAGIEESDFVLVIGADPINEAPMLALALRQVFRRGGRVAVVDPRPITLPLDFEHLAIPPAELGSALSRLFACASAEEEGKTWEKEEDESGIAALLRGSERPVVVCGTGLPEAEIQDPAADGVRSLAGQGKVPGLFFLLPEVNSFGAALLPAADGHAFEDMVTAIERGEIRGLLIVESDPLAMYHDRQRLERAFGRLEFLAVLDYLPSATVSLAHHLLPTACLFECGASFINQEGRLQFAAPVHQGGLPVRQVSGGGHPPRIFTNEIPGEPKSAWEVLQALGRACGLEAAEMGTASAWEAVAGEIPALAGLAPKLYPFDGARVLAGRPGPPGSHAQSAGDSRRPASPDLLEVLLVEQTFGSEELASYSEVIQEVEEEPCAVMQADEAGALGLSHGDRVRLPIGREGIEIPLRLEAHMAAGAILLPRHRRLDWQQFGKQPVRLPAARIRKIDSQGG